MSDIVEQWKRAYVLGRERDAVATSLAAALHVTKEDVLCNATCGTMDEITHVEGCPIAIAKHALGPTRRENGLT